MFPGVIRQPINGIDAWGPALLGTVLAMDVGPVDECRAIARWSTVHQEEQLLSLFGGDGD